MCDAAGHDTEDTAYGSYWCYTCKARVPMGRSTPVGVTLGSGGCAHKFVAQAGKVFCEKCGKKGST